MDFLDRAGDKESFIHRMQRKPIAMLAFSSQGAGLVLLSFLVHEGAGALVLCVIALLSPLSLFLWLGGTKPRAAAVIMKIQMFVGLYFLL